MNSASSDSTCGDYFVFDTWLKNTLIASLPIIVLFCFLEHRVNLWPNFLNGRPGIATPVNLIDAYGDRLASALAFVCVSVLVFNKITNNEQEPDVSAAQSSTDTVPVMLRGVLGFLNEIWNALLVSTACYPICLCIGTKHKVTGKAIGVFYSLIWTVFYIGRLAGCTNGHLLEVLSDVWISGPGCVCFVLLAFRFVHGLVKYLYRSQLHHLSSLKGHMAPGQAASSKFEESHFYQRTKYLLSRPLPKEYGGNFISRVFRKYFNHERGFKYSRQNIAVLAMVLLLTYLSCTVNIGLWPVIDSIENSVKMFGIVKLKVTFLLANVVTFIICMLSNIDAQKRYREHTLQLWRGDRSFGAGIVLSNEAIMMHSTRYIGYRLAFAIIGFEFTFLVIWLCFELIKLFFVKTLQDYWLAAVLFMIWSFAQSVMYRLVFLQREDDEDRSRNIFRQRKTYLGLDNRRVFHVVFYFTLFVNVISGALGFLDRLLKSVLFGVCLVGRADRCALQRDWESHDDAFMAYISFLQLEVSHTHPVVITFCHLLNESIVPKNVTQLPNQAHLKIYTPRSMKTVSEGPSSGHPTVPTVSRVMSSRVRNRWFLALTLSRNLTLIPLRKKPEDDILSLLVINNS